MGRKIIIEPTFCEAHFLDAHIKNMCDYIKPDIFVLAEGMFPKGPENNTESLSSFAGKYTKDGDGHRGWDFDEVTQIIRQNGALYPDIDFYLLAMNYDADMTTERAYYEAYTSFRRVVPPLPDDIILPLESDLFFTEEQANQILTLAEGLEFNEGFGSTFKLFFESPKVCIPGAGNGGRKRKVAYVYGDGKLCEVIALGNFTESYHAYITWHDLQLFHYEWIRPGKYWDMRFDQLSRKSYVYEALKRARVLIEHDPPHLKEDLETMVGWEGSFTLVANDLKIEDHPKHIRKHPNFIKYYGNEKNSN